MATASSTESDIQLSQGQSPSQVATIPEGFISIQQIRDLPNEKILQKCLVNVIGLVTDFQAPMPTNGSGKISDPVGN